MKNSEEPELTSEVGDQEEPRPKLHGRTPSSWIARTYLVSRHAHRHLASWPPSETSASLLRGSVNSVSCPTTGSTPDAKIVG